MAFAPYSRARLSLGPPSRAGDVTTPQASLHATDRIVAPPNGALDAGLRPDPFPDRAASLLPGLLAATRTGLPPAGDDELTNTKNHHGITSRRYLPFCWAHEIGSVKTEAVREAAERRMSYVKQRWKPVCLLQHQRVRLPWLMPILSMALTRRICLLQSLLPLAQSKPRLTVVLLIVWSWTVRPSLICLLT